MGPSINEILALLRDAFPGGILEEITPDDSLHKPTGVLYRETFRIGLHRILIEEDGFKLNLHWQPALQFNFAGTPPAFDSCEIQTQDDLIGWVSYVRGQIEERSLRSFSWAIQPKDLLPQGNNSIKGLLEPRKALLACGLTKAQITEKLSRELDIPWKTNPGNDKLMFNVNGAGQGQVVGRIVPAQGPVGPTLGIFTLEHAYDIPISRVRLAGKNLGGIVLHAPVSAGPLDHLEVQRVKLELLQQAKASLASVYTNAVLGYVFDQLDEKDKPGLIVRWP